MNKQQYPTDMTDSQWDIIQQMIPPAKSGGRPHSLDMRQVINAILYIVVGGIPVTVVASLGVQALANQRFALLTHRVLTA